MVPRSVVRQRGAIGLMAALTMGLALVFMLLTVDSGRLYLEQRKLQRIADMAALEAAEHDGACTGSGPQASTLARTAATRNGHSPLNPLIASCGYLRTGNDNLRTFTADNQRNEAIKVEVSNVVVTSFAGGIYALVQGGAIARTTTLRASAVAANPGPPQAMLSIRSTLLQVSSMQSAILNALLKAIGASTQLTVLGWQGIADTQLNLLDYLDALSTDLHLNLGDYQQLLNLQTTADKLLDVAVKVLQQSGAAVEVTGNLLKLAADLKGPITVGQLLNLQTGTVQAGLDANVQLLQLVQAMIQLAANRQAVNAEIPITVLGLINGRVYLKVIQPPQNSAVGDPRSDELRVHTAQIRALVSLDLPLLTGIAGLLNAVLDLAAPLTNVLNNLLSLNLLGTVQSLTCALGIPCKVSDIKLLDSQVHIDIGIEVAEGTSRLRPAPPDNYSCAPKSLTTLTQRSAARIAIGKFDSPAEFLSNGPDLVKVQALPVIDIGTNVCSRLLILPPSCGTRVPYAGGGIGLRVDTKLLGSSPTEKPLVFAGDHAPRTIGQDPMFQPMDSDQGQVVGSLSGTLAGVHLEAYRPTANSGLGQVLVLTAGLLDGVKNILEPIIRNLLSPLLDPLVNGLLKVLGIDLASAEVGANLSCSSGHAQLVQ
ncbi:MULTISPECIES: pilus assembly protein TadG-related protein [Pseudomonas]|nr:MULTISPECIES: pilus assembly protein TadG-related protein [Pseudomonas]MCX5510715.1 pilus assembly protein TadG-related protein [Pseudomonas sp. BJa3]MEE1882910.1 pilus assembly protein TadG-related protein [Pseudomonas soli]UXZ46850.1 pilus assembly protein TadG-related protein [Pseudomonas soli]WJO21258.1 pilus assembly protein TadG-related protein [Pseudomonas soli]SES02793.1 Putative Flp pilus-assembly TadE/G-like [Pseudomonas soli]